MTYACTGCELLVWCLANNQFLPDQFGPNDYVRLSICETCDRRELAYVTWADGFYVSSQRIVKSPPPCYSQVPKDKKRSLGFICTRCAEKRDPK
jgi:hypothetical protein